MTFFNIKTIWYLILCIIATTILVDSNLHHDAWLAMFLFSIPYCFFLLLIGFVYHLLFKNFKTFSEPVVCLVKILFCVLIFATSFQLLAILLEHFFGSSIEKYYRYIKFNPLSILMYSQAPTLVVFIIFIFHKMFKKD